MFAKLQNKLIISNENYFNESKQHLSNITPNVYQSAVKLILKYYPTDAKTDIDQPLITHLIESAKIVNTLGLSEPSILATLFSYFPAYYPSDWKEKLTPYINSKIELLITGINQIQALTNFVKVTEIVAQEEKNKQSEAMKKMLLAMVSDIRIVLIKLCMVTENIKTLSKSPKHINKKTIAQETLDIFAPLANRLGVWQLHWQLEDLGFRHHNPVEYRKIANLLHEKIDSRLEYINNIITTLKTKLEQENIKCELAGRPKHIYSIYKKMQKNKLRFDELYDTRAVRVLVETVPQCYHVLGVVHNLWQPITGKFRDYISQPKPNDYRSLHTIIVGPGNKEVEVQIRTFEMHHFAEFGVAAHWQYKEGGQIDSIYEQKIAWLRQLLEWRNDISVTNESSLASAFRAELFNDTIFVLTPKGKVLSLPSGSTPIDFAYTLHSDIGNRCRGAKIDGHIAPLSTPLKNGQRIEIITSQDGHPSVNWLYEGWVKSRKAISKIRTYIRQQNIEAVKESGKHCLEKELHQLHKRPSLQDLVNHLGYPSLDNLYIAIGNGDLSPRQIKKSVRVLLTKHERVVIVENKPIIKSSKIKKPENKGILINGESDLLSMFAKCCKPAPPDDLIGFITQGRGVSIHRKNCKSFQYLVKRHPNKIVKAEWSDLHKMASLFSVDIAIFAQDRNALLRDISDVFARNKINVTGIQSHASGITAKMKFTIEIKKINDLPNVLSSLGNISDVFEVYRA